MTQPLNKATDCRTVGLTDGGCGRFPSDRPTVRRSDGFVAANIPIANRILPHPASRPGIPLARNSRASAYTMRDVPGVVSAHRAARASAGGRRRVASTARAASIPRP